MLRFIATASSSGEKIEEQVMSSNPVIEAFGTMTLRIAQTHFLIGNAKTTRNNNSSRFGKWLEVLMYEGKIEGLNVTNYLLEKSRVVRQSEGERNYHIFFQSIQFVHLNADHVFSALRN